MRAPDAYQWRDFGASVRSLRQSRGWSLRGFAREIPIAHSYEVFIESGRVPPPSDAVITRMAEILEVPAQQLLTQAGRLPVDVLVAFWQHPAVPPILSTIPGMSLDDAQTFCKSVISSLP